VSAIRFDLTPNLFSDLKQYLLDLTGKDNMLEPSATQDFSAQQVLQVQLMCEQRIPEARLL
jgi:hypothetical protein